MNSEIKDTNDKLIKERMDEMAKDMQRALEKVFYPLKVKVTPDHGRGSCYLVYSHPFYFENDKVEKYFGVGITHNQVIPDYPLTCRATTDSTDGEIDAYIVIEDADDWINHASTFIWHYDECVDLMNKLDGSSDNASSIVADVKRALDVIFFPFDIETWEDNIDDEYGVKASIRYIDYELPFRLKPFADPPAIWFEGPAKYPLQCGIHYEDGETRQSTTFIVKDSDEWLYHAHEFIPQYEEYTAFMIKCATREQ